MLIGGEEPRTFEFERPLGLKDDASLPNALGGDIAGLLLMLAAVLVLVGREDEKEESCDRTPDWKLEVEPRSDPMPMLDL
jgi:hypothetical protein